KTADKLIGKDGDQLVQVVASLAVMTKGIDANVGSVQNVLKLAGPKLQRLMGILNDGRYVRGAVPCLTLVDGNCPYPVVLERYSGNPQSGQTMQKMLTGGN